MKSKYKQKTEDKMTYRNRLLKLVVIGGVLSMIVAVVISSFYDFNSVCGDNNQCISDRAYSLTISIGSMGVGMSVIIAVIYLKIEENRNRLKKNKE